MDISNIKMIENTLEKVYKTKSYPDDLDFVISEDFLIDICHKIANEMKNDNYEIINCKDAPYMLQMRMSLSKEIPLISRGKKNDDKYFYEYGQINLTFSKLINNAMIHWQIFKRILFFSFSEKIYYPPHIMWCPIVSEILNILNSFKIYLLYPPELLKRYKYNYKGRLYSTNNPSLEILLFDEEV